VLHIWESAPCSRQEPLGDRALSQQRADSTERGVLVTAVRRVRVLGVLPEHDLVPLRVGLKRALRREG
jgi:hypothetical protein